MRDVEASIVQAEHDRRDVEKELLEARYEVDKKALKDEMEQVGAYLHRWRSLRLMCRWMQ